VPLTLHPSARGLVASLARQWGNITGFTSIVIEPTPKRVELLCELVPQAVIALLVNPDNVIAEQYIRTTQEAARAKGIQLPVLKAGAEGEIDTAFASLGQLQAGGLVVAADTFFIPRREQLVALALAMPFRRPMRVEGSLRPAASSATELTTQLSLVRPVFTLERFCTAPSKDGRPINRDGSSSTRGSASRSSRRAGFTPPSRNSFLYSSKRPV
jgi:hypothetical protein